LDSFAGKEDLIAKPFLSLCLLQFMMKQICPASTWSARVKSLLAEFPKNGTKNRATIADIGCIDGWESWDLWN
jgi:abortive infection bacteriophage resistance protein